MKTEELIIRNYLAKSEVNFTQEEIEGLVVSLQKDYDNEVRNLAQCPCCDKVFKISEIEDEICVHPGNYDSPSEYNYVCPKCDEDMGESIIEPDLLSYLHYTE